MIRSLALVLVSLGLAVGCGGGSDGASPTTTGGDTAVVNPLGPTVDKDRVMTGQIAMKQTTTIAPGATLHLAPGAKLYAAAGTALVIQGKLEVGGSGSAPVAFESEAHQGAKGWIGIQIASGGSAQIEHAEIHDATIALDAAAGSMFAVDYLLVDTSDQAAQLASDGTLAHGVLHANGKDQMNDVIVVNTASPHISDTLVDNGNDGADHIAVNGMASSPVFDHMEVTACHCAFHFNEGKNVTIKGSVMHDTQYGLMALGSVGTTLDGNNFYANTVNVGDCNPQLAVTVKGNYFDKEAFDESCKAQANGTPASAKLTDAGPRL